jgi:hypothetical protein
MVVLYTMQVIYIYFERGPEKWSGKEHLVGDIYCFQLIRQNLVLQGPLN